MLLHMKDEGRSWSEISTAWETMTGKQPKGLHMRYSRMKANFVTLNADHVSTVHSAPACSDVSVRR